MPNHTDEKSRSTPAESMVAKRMRGIHRQTMNMPSAMAGVMGDPGKTRAKKYFKERVVERGRTKREIKKGRWSGKSARLRVGGTFGS